MSAANNRHGFKVIRPGDRVEMSGSALVIHHPPKPVPPNQALLTLRENLKNLTELHAQLKKMLEELEALVK